MSGIYLPGAEAPKDCAACPAVSCYWRCDGKSRHCTIISVPDHGDLIDRNALLNEVADVLPEPWDEESAYMLESGYSRSRIYEAEIVIPSDPGKEDAP